MHGRMPVMAGKPKTTTRARRKPAAPVPAILSGRDLVKDFQTNGSHTRALDGVSLDVPAGGFVSVMGPSGSGKSTLLHLLGGLDSPTSGDVLLEGKPLSGLSDKDVTLARRGSVGFVFQFFNLVPVLTVAENIALPLVIAGQSPDSYRSRLDEVIDRVDLGDCVEKLPSQISGGQQQRTAIARAIFPEPAVVLADEPTGNLDRPTGLRVFELLLELNAALGTSLVVVTHDPDLAARMDRVLELKDGVLMPA
jgi:putative ABC transport system ATP-binding protein